MKCKARITDYLINFNNNKVKITFELEIEPQTALKNIEKLQENEVSVEFKKYYESRSLDANAYCWKLCDLIAKNIGHGMTKETVYKDAIANIGTYENMIIAEKAYENFKRVWQRQGLGFVIREVTRKNKCVKFQAYYGSSTYNTKEMSILIDFLVNECNNLEIETKTETEINSLLEEWNKT